MSDELKKGEQGHTISGAPARSEEDELKRKSWRKRGLWERSGKEADEHSLHPRSKDNGEMGESNVGEDELSGGEGLDPDPLPPKT